MKNYIETHKNLTIELDYSTNNIRLYFSQTPSYYFRRKLIKHGYVYNSFLYKIWQRHASIRAIRAIKKMFNIDTSMLKKAFKMRSQNATIKKGENNENRRY